LTAIGWTLNVLIISSADQESNGMETTSSVGDVGTGFGRAPGTYIKSLTEVGPATQMGNLLRRYWHPVGLGSYATETPREVRVLGEDLILFRDRSGRPGLMHARCAHRGTTLYFGKVEERGIRCCYHGWLFDVEGRCLEQPCEPEGGRFRDRVRQPWYPLREQYGLIFAYMGPPEKKPVLPRYECLEVLGEGEFIDADDTSIGSGGPQIVPCNWLQHFENVVDPYHVVVLHGTHSGPQFSEMMARMPDEVHFERTPLGVRASSTRRLADGSVMRGSAEVALPTLRVVPNPRAGVAGASLVGRVESIGWTLPIDDTHFRIYVAGRVREKGQLRRMRSRQGGKLWEELSPEEHQRFPGDFEAQTGQGAITLHSEEHLVESDRGIALLRQFLRQQMELVAQGRDPAGVAFDAETPPVTFAASRELQDAAE
jgi:nitrite reductase/ring-hydroxylating ferredoxin subunit